MTSAYILSMATPPRRTAEGMWMFPFPFFSGFYYGARALESGGGLVIIAVGAAIIIWLAVKRPAHWRLWAIATAIVSIILALVSGGRHRRY